MIIGLLFTFLLSIQPGTPPIKIPETARQVLNQHLTVSWRLSGDTLYTCNFNDDTLPDYALAVTLGDGECLSEYFVALVSHPDGYSFHLLATFPPGFIGSMGLLLKAKGSSVPQYTDTTDVEPQNIVLTTDGVELVPYVGCCAVILLYRDGYFHMVTSSD